MIYKTLSMLVVAISIFCPESHAEERLKVGLVLGGGGARGAAHIGVIRELERLRIPIDYVTGTSIGAIVGAMYASGMSTEQMESVLAETDWVGIFKDQAPRRDASIRRKFDDRIFQINKEVGIKDGAVKLPSGLIQGQKLQILLDRLMLPVADIENFDDLPIPFRAVAADIATSRAVVLDSGSLSTAIRASMSVPSIFSTVDHNGQILVDGGIANNLPVDVARNMGADVVIAVDIGTSLLRDDQLDNAIAITVQLTNILVRRTTEAQIATMTETDVLITPELGEFSSADFENSASIIPLGIEAARQESDKLATLSLAPASYSDYAKVKEATVQPVPIISFIAIENDSPLADDYLLSRVRQKPGEPLDFEQLEQDISVIYGLEIFKTVNYRVEERDGEAGLVLQAVQKPWGPKYLQFGMRYSSDLHDSNNLAITLGYTVTPINVWNGEWRTILQLGEEPALVTEFNQPLGIGSPYFVNATLGYTNERFNFFEDGNKVRQVRARTYGIRGALGREFGPSGDVRFGVSRYFSSNEVEIGTPTGGVVDVDGGEFFALTRIDTLDSPFFPTSGVRGLVAWTGSRSALGADREFDQAQLDLMGAATFGTNTMLLGARYFTTYRGIAPVQDRVRTGGLFELPGFIENEISGQNLYLFRSGYQRKIANLFNTSPYLGLTLQYGQVSESDEELDLSDGIIAAGVWLGWDSVIGPIYSGYGRNDTGEQSVYLVIGRPF